MDERVIHGLRVFVQSARDLPGGLRLPGERSFHPVQKLQDAGRRLFPGLHSRLVVGIYVHQRTVKADGAVIERDERPDRECSDRRQADGDGIPPPSKSAVRVPRRNP